MSLTTPMKLILALIAMAVILVGFYLLDWQRKIQDRTDLQQRSVERQADYQSIVAQLRELPTLTHDNETLKADLAALVQGHLKGSDNVDAMVSDMLVHLEQTVGQVGSPLSIGTLTPGAGKATPPTAATPASTVLERFPNRQFNLQMQGNFKTLLTFLDAVSALSLDHLVTVDSLTLTPSGTSASGSPELSISLPITAYSKSGGK